LRLIAQAYEIGTSFFQSCQVFEDTILPDNLAALNHALKASRRPYLEPAGPEITGISTQLTSNGVLVTATADDSRRSTSNADGEPADPQHAITQAQLSINTVPFNSADLLTMRASDGNFNSSSEAVDVLVPFAALSGSRDTFYIVATDSTGQTGVPSAIFFSDTIFLDDFE